MRIFIAVSMLLTGCIERTTTVPIEHGQQFETAGSGEVCVTDVKFDSQRYVVFESDHGLFVLPKQATEVIVVPQD